MKENLIAETNGRLAEIINNLTTIKDEYETKLNANNKEIDTELARVQEYKAEFFESKAKIEKMNADIEGFESDYKNLVERFKDDELANILIAANKEISLKIDERKRKIIKDKSAMNELVDKAENVKQKLVKLTAEKKALELCLSEIHDAFDFYSNSLNQVINYANDNKNNLAACFKEGSSLINPEIKLINNEYDNEIPVEDNYNEDYTESYPTEYDINPLSDVEDEEMDELGTVDLSGMIKVDEETEISDYDNASISENEGQEIVNDPTELVQEIQINDDNQDEYTLEDNNNQEVIEEENNKKKKKNKNKGIFNVDEFDDELQDDDSLYEE